MAAASLIAVEFITPQPRQQHVVGLILANGEPLRFLLHTGVVDGDALKVKPLIFARTSSTGIGSLP